MTSITPCLWFDGQAEAAATFYVGLMPGSRIDNVMHAPADYPAGKRGDVLLVEFTLAGRPFQALNGGGGMKFTEAVSMSITADGQTDADRLWDALIADGGAPSQCGWLKDKFGLSWQVVPSGFTQLMADPDPARAQRAMAAMMTMTRLDLAAMRAAADGVAA